MYGPMLEMLDEAGDPADLLGWIDDVGLVVVNGESGVTGGLVVVAKDAAAASERAGALKGLLSLAGLGGSGIETSDSTINGVTVTTVTISNLGSLPTGGQIPPGFLPEDGTLEFSIATKDRVILLTAGAGDSFMTAALNVQPGAGLADQAGYKTATALALRNSQATVYVAIRDIVGIVEPLLPAEARAQWDELKPYIAPFQALSMTSAADAAASWPFAADHHDQQPLAQPSHQEEFMAVRIRLTRVGAKKQPSYRVVVANSRKARDSRSIETLGHYNPRTDPIELNIDADKAKAWLAKGALPSDTVARLFRSAGVLPAEKATKGAAK